MTEPGLSQDALRNHLKGVLEEAGFSVQSWNVSGLEEPVILAENAYHIIAFQIFEAWQDLVEKVDSIEIELSALIGKSEAKSKAWDAYLVLACRAGISGSSEINQMSSLTYNTNRTRKIIRANIGDSLTKLEEIVTPFLALKKAEYSAKGRDPLDLLQAKMIAAGHDRTTVERAVTSFKETGRVADA